MADVTSVILGAWNFVRDKWIWVFYFALAGIAIWVIGTIIYNKHIFRYPVRIFKIRENGKVLEDNRKGGYIGRKNSAPFFRIKLGRWWWQYVDLTSTPNPAFMDEQNRVYYNQIDVKTYVQLRRDFIPNHAVNMTPVECDVKYAAILDCQRIKEVLRTESTWAKFAPYFALSLIFVAAILGWWFVMNGKCPGAG